MQVKLFDELGQEVTGLTPETIAEIQKMLAEKDYVLVDVTEEGVFNAPVNAGGDAENPQPPPAADVPPSQAEDFEKDPNWLPNIPPPTERVQLKKKSKAAKNPQPPPAEPAPTAAKETEKKKKGNKVEKLYKEVTEDELDSIAAATVADNTKQQTVWAVKKFKGKSSKNSLIVLVYKAKFKCRRFNHLSIDK